MYEDIKRLLENYKPTNNTEQDAEIQRMLSLCFQVIMRLETQNGELVEKILKIERVESTLLNEIESIKNKTSDFLGSWVRYNW
jgi:hypothetical protein